MNGLFSTDGPIFRAMSDLLSLFLINILTIVCCLPVVTAGAAFCSMHYCVMKIQDGEDANVISMFFEQFKVNFKSITPVWLVYLGTGVLLGFFFRTVSLNQTQVSNPVLVILYVLIAVYVAMFAWLFPMAARFENSAVAKIKNAILMTVGAFPQTVGMVAIWVVILFVLSQSYRLIPLLFVFGLSPPAYLSSFLYYPMIKKQIERMTTEPEDTESGNP